MLVLQSPNLARFAGVTHGFFGRTGGVSKGVYTALNCGLGSRDERDAIVENRRRVAANLAPTAELVTLDQAHGTNVITVSEAWPTGATRADDAKLIPLGDAMVTRAPDIALGILTADCAPVLFADGDARVIGAAHAGWKGALSGVIEATLAAMEALGAQRSRIAAAIGPCISQANYEVGPEFRERFLAADGANGRYFVASERAHHHRFDLEAYVADRLMRAGLADVARLAACTYAREGDFFSYRRATHRGEPDYGREVSAILLRN